MVLIPLAMKLHWLFLSPIIRGGGIIIDAGTNQGFYTSAMLQENPDIQTIIMIEPQPFLAGNLQAIVDSVQSVSLEPVAVDSSAGSMELYFDQQGSGLASLYERDIRHVGAKLGRSVSVPVTTIDAIAEKHGLEFIDYLKLDLEGHELEALKGASSLLASRKIGAITFEFGGCNIDSKTYLKDFWRLLVDGYGFTFYRLLPGRRLLKLDSYSESIERFTWQNILASVHGNSLLISEII
jgi:FkbM family methyltransferase